MALEESNNILVVGNGESRKDVDLNLFKNYITVGCNALHRDFTTDYLVCCDRRMADEAVRNPYTNNTLIYVREEWYRHFRKVLKNKNIQQLPELPFRGELKKDQPEHWGSGCYAVLLAAHSKSKCIYLLGFDLYSSTNSVNNVYKGTQNYSKVESPAVDYSFWIYQIGKVFRHFTDKKFTIINNADWKLPDSWLLENVEFRNIEQLTVDS
jgi:hypothetical protein